MGQAGRFLRRGEGAYFHWCPACEEMHPLPDSWSFNGDLERPTFRPSFRHEGIQRIFENGRWTGEWRRDASGSTIPYVCHYVLTAGVINYCQDCTHAMASKSVPLPELPAELTDDGP